MLEAARFDERVRGADLVITGEGRVDAQSAYGKLTQAVTEAARRANVPVAAIAGGTDAGYEALFAAGLDALELVTDRPMPLGEAMAQAASLVEGAAERLARSIEVGRRLRQ